MLACAAGSDPDVMVLEGQSALRNQAGSGAGSRRIVIAGDAHAIVLQHSPARVFFDGLEDRGCRIPHVVEHAGGATVRDESSPRHHHRFTDRDRIGRSRQRQGVGPSRSGRRIGRIEDAELQFADRDD